MPVLSRFNAGLLAEVTGGIEYSQDPIRVMLVNGYDPDLQFDVCRGDVTQEASGTGYQAGGVECPAAASVDGLTGIQTVTLGPVTFSSVTVAATGAVFYVSRGSRHEDALIASLTFDDPIAASSEDVVIGAQALTREGAASGLVRYQSTLLDELTGKIDYLRDRIRVMLVNGYTVDVVTHATRADITGEVIGTGYVTGGKECQAATSIDAITGVQSTMLDAVTWHNVTIEATGAVWYVDNGGISSDDLLVAALTFAEPLMVEAKSVVIGTQVLRRRSIASIVCDYSALNPIQSDSIIYATTIICA